MLPISFIEIQNQILGAAVEINGTQFSLNYSSDRTPGRLAAYTRTIPVSGSHVAADLERIEIEIDIAGQHFIKTFPPETIKLIPLSGMAKILKVGYCQVSNLSRFALLISIRTRNTISAKKERLL
ncbi:MAG: hypothetical protein HC942_06930 [Microcoleus sp. SU_5_6]|nr:hypothetical protein [Microcoleus sp. SU_5_6]